VIAVGEEPRWIAEAARAAGVREVIHVGTTDEAAQALHAFAREGDVVLLKGSRSAKMERVLPVLESLEKGGAA
jgi:UDP-N-acetylmuramoyl-tripeptide--D-alanyl-D-alanine ligase